MDIEIMVALIAFGGTFGGSIIGAFVSSKVTDLRLQQLERKQDRHNSVIERMFVIEGKICNIEDKVQNFVKE